MGLAIRMITPSDLLSSADFLTENSQGYYEYEPSDEDIDLLWDGDGILYLNDDGELNEGGVKSLEYDLGESTAVIDSLFYALLDTYRNITNTEETPEDLIYEAMQDIVIVVSDETVKRYSERY